MPLVSITRLRVRSRRYLPGFLWYALLAVRQARSAQGIVGASLLRDANHVFWTRTVWTDEAAMRAFMTAGAHRKVMPHLLDWCDEASLVHWQQDTSAPPSWSEAHRRLQQEGRRSKVRHPSEAQQRFEIPPPRVSAGA